MGRNSKIEWTDHTFNPWWGCTKVSAACKNCYAEAWAKRVGSRVWGASAPRRFLSDDHWKQPIIWNREALAAGIRRRVFCASMADVFEPRKDLDPWREKLWRLIQQTPHLDWLLLTKRPDRARRHVPWGEQWPSNVWIGTTIESQRWVEYRLSHLADCDARIRFVSCEPLLSRLDLTSWLHVVINWVIAGGESGARARPSLPSWFRELRDQCIDQRIPFHFKQWGDWSPLDSTGSDTSYSITRQSNEITMVRKGKVRAGRLLDGQEWNGVPEL